MSYTYQKQLAHQSNYGGARTSDKIKYIVCHATGNDGDSSANNARYFQSQGRGASAHYFVDDNTVYQSVPDLSVAWSVGGNKYQDCAQTGGGSFYKIATNLNTLNIELCDTKRDGAIMASEKTIENAVKLIQELMKKYHIPKDRVIRHFDVTGKKCPSYFVEETAWAGFKVRLSQNKQEQEVKPEKEEPAPEEHKAEKYRVTSRNGLNIRAGAGTKHKKLYALAEGDAFNVDSFAGEWAHGKDNLNREGYAYTR